MLKKINFFIKEKKGSDVRRSILIADFTDYQKLIIKKVGTEEIHTITMGHELTKEEKKEIALYVLDNKTSFTASELSLLCDAFINDSDYSLSEEDLVILRTTAILKGKREEKREKSMHSEIVSVANEMIDELIERDIETMIVNNCIEEDIVIDPDVLKNVSQILVQIVDKLGIELGKYNDGMQYIIDLIFNYLKDNDLNEINYSVVINALKTLNGLEDEKSMAINELAKREGKRSLGKVF